METNQGHYRQLFSGVADIVTMLLVAPMLLLCALPTVGAIAFVVYRRKKKAESAPAEPGLPIFWRIENKVIALHDAVARATPKVTQPLINAHGWAAYIKQIIEDFRRILQQERNRYDE